MVSVPPEALSAILEGIMKTPSRAEAGELALLAEIRRRARAGGVRSAGLVLGIGDDCALLRLRPGEEVAVTTDLSIDGRHFRLQTHPPEAVGHRALARGLSDLAAMGARPVAAFVSLGLPVELASRLRGRRAWVDLFYDGLLALARQFRTPLAGGDLAESPVALADIVLVGAVPRGKALRRSGAHAGDVIYVTGTLGGSAAGLALLLSSQFSVRSSQQKPARATSSARIKAENASGHDFSRAENTSFKTTRALASAVLRAQISRPAANYELRTRNCELDSHLYPQPRIVQGERLRKRGLASAAIDISDGLSTDLAHLCRESSLSAEIDADAIPAAPTATLDQALHGGEDYELLFTAPAAAHVPRAIAGVPVTRIGRMVPRRAGRPQITLVTSSGVQPVEPRGWQHFAWVTQSLSPVTLPHSPFRLQCLAFHPTALPRARK
jgi:thiamine-monophosphate kinase